jgi:hypothetical protein
MTSTLIPSAGQLVSAGLVAVAVVIVGVVAAAYWARRRWRRLRLSLPGLLRRWAFDAGSAGMIWLWARPLPDRRWPVVHSARRRLARAMAAATRAVDVAHGTGAPLGDLRALLGSLRKSAKDIDASLRIAQHADAPQVDLRSLLCKTDELISAAHQIEHTAFAALAAFSAPSVTTLTGDVRRETAAVAAGVTAAAHDVRALL